MTTLLSGFAGPWPDPAAEPHVIYCDICDEPEYPADLTPDWNGETGCHLSCEERQQDWAGDDPCVRNLGGDEPSYRAELQNAGRGHLIR